jgi:hypothetical protein
MKELALKFPVLIAFAIEVGISTWHLKANSRFITIATPNTFDCFRTFEYDSHGSRGETSS